MNKEKAAAVKARPLPSASDSLELHSDTHHYVVTFQFHVGQNVQIRAEPRLFRAEVAVAQVQREPPVEGYPQAGSCLVGKDRVCVTGMEQQSPQAIAAKGVAQMKRGKANT